MPELKWTTNAEVSAEQDYVVFASQLPAAGLRSVPSFMLHTMRINRQLRKSPGLIGYSLRADVLKARFWTLSVWEDETALHDFVRAEPHAGTMRALRSVTRDPTFSTWRTQAPLPLPSWQEVAERLQEERRARVASRVSKA